MTITINRDNIEAIFGDAPAPTELKAPAGAEGRPAIQPAPASFSIFARRRRRRPGEARQASRRPASAEPAHGRSLRRAP